jgi:hypothetical protein
MDNTILEINNMEDKDLICFLSSKSIKYLLKLYKCKDLNFRIKNYIKVLDEKRFIDCYDLDLYAYLRVFTTSKCIDYYVLEGLINKKNMPYLPYVVYYLGLSTRILNYYVDQYAYYPDGLGLFDNGTDYDPKNRDKWFKGLTDNTIYLKLLTRD